jgi:DNA repair protein RadC
MQHLSFEPQYEPKVKDLPLREQPVHRLRDAGPTAISTTEVLACLLQTTDALRQAGELLARFEGLPGILRASEQEIRQIRGIGPSGAARLKAALECGRRLMADAPDSRATIRSPADIAQLLMAEIAHEEQEHFKVVLLDTRNQLIANTTLYVGNVNSNHVRIAEVFRDAVWRNASAIIVAHNHPSGDPTPSPEDVEVTRRIVQAGDLVEIDVLDHLVIGHQRFVSLRERGLGFS